MYMLNLKNEVMCKYNGCNNKTSFLDTDNEPQ